MVVKVKKFKNNLYQFLCKYKYDVLEVCFRHEMRHVALQ